MRVRGLAAVAAAVLLAAGVAVAAAASANATASNTTLTGMLQEAFRSPRVAVAVAIQFLLGLGLGYYSVKVARYLLALIGIIVLGSMLSVWSLGGSTQSLAAKVASEVRQVEPVVKNLLATLGILTVGPVAAGFIVGLIIGFTRK